MDEKSTNKSTPFLSALRVQDVSKNFAGLKVLDAVTLSVAAGERRAIIGPNGAGKTTLFHLITGHLTPAQGEIFLDEQNITPLAVHQRANLGLGHTFQRNNLFPGLTVIETIRLAVQHRQGVAHHPFKRAAAFQPVNREIEKILQQVALADVGHMPVSQLAYGQQRVLEIALSLAAASRLLLLDEPTAGMSPAETLEMIQLLQSLPRTLTLLIIEHDMDVVFKLADMITVLHHGQIINQGSPATVRADPRVQEIYLGTELHQTGRA